MLDSIKRGLLDQETARQLGRRFWRERNAAYDRSFVIIDPNQVMNEWTSRLDIPRKNIHIARQETAASARMTFQKELGLVSSYSWLQFTGISTHDLPLGQARY